MSALATSTTALARGDGTIVLVAGQSSDREAIATALVAHGLVVVSSGTTTLDPETLEVDGAEARLLVAPRGDPDAVEPVVRALSGGEAAYVVGSQATTLAEVDGGALAVLARLARRLAAYEVRYADPAVGAREVARLWSSR